MKTITCSGLARPMVCAGYVFLDLPRQADNGNGDEGEAAGEYLERLLLDKDLPPVSSKGIHFDDDMKFYGNAVNDDVKSRAVGEIKCEQKINWQTQSGVWIKGRYDIGFIDERGYLCIEDLKYGWGIVEVEKNWQLLGYAIGEVIRRGQAFEKISLRIHQPRPHHEDGDSREWLITYSELLEYKAQIEKRFDDITNGMRDLQTSDKCKYCMGSAEACPAFNRVFYRAIEVSTEFFQDSIDDSELSRQLDIIKKAEEVIKIKKDSLTELGTMRIKEGKIIPGYTQKQTYGNRAWRKGVSPESIKMMTGKDVVETKFMTPAKAQKLGISKDFINQLCEKKLSTVKLVKDDGQDGNNIFGNTNPNGGK